MKYSVAIVSSTLNIDGIDYPVGGGPGQLFSEKSLTAVWSNTFSEKNDKPFIENNFGTVVK